MIKNNLLLEKLSVKVRSYNEDVNRNLQSVAVSQNFITIITLLRSAALKAYEYKKQLVLQQQASIDHEHIDTLISEFSKSFDNNRRLADTQIDESIAACDAIIKQAENMRSKLVAAKRNVRLASDKITDFKEDYKKCQKN